MYLSLSPSQETILAALCYGEIFNFPLRVEEFFTYMPLRPISPEALKEDLNALIQKELVYHHDGYYTLAGRVGDIEARENKAGRFDRKWARLREELPGLLRHSWVKGVLLTGSMAAKNPDGNADADLLLVLDGRRMWIGYLWVRLWCKMGRKGHYCPNYVLAESELSLSFPNYFTAIEYAMSVPLKWHDCWPAMESANPWFKSYLPNSLPFRDRMDPLPFQRSIWSRCMDWIIESPIGWILNKLEWWRLRYKTKGIYTPTPLVYKPHSPKRQWLIFKKLRESLNRHRIEFAPLRAHIDSEIELLEEAGNHWQSDDRKTSASSAKNARVGDVCSNKIAN